MSDTPPIVKSGEVPKQWKNVERDERGRLKPKNLSVSPRGASARIKQRFGKLAFKLLKEELSEEKFREVLKTLIKIGAMPKHKDCARVGEFLLRLATDPDKANEASTQNINITLTAIRENASAQQAFLNIRPISVQIIEAAKVDAGGCDPAPVRELPAPVSGPASE